MWSVISRGPVAQFMPRAANGKRASVATTAAISEPTRRVPVVSTVTCTMSGTSTFAAAIASIIACTAILH
jgi:hypothetical protein